MAAIIGSCLESKLYTVKIQAVIEMVLALNLGDLCFRDNPTFHRSPTDPFIL